MLGLVEWQTNSLGHLTCILNNLYILIILCSNFCCEWISCYQDTGYYAESHTNEVCPASGVEENRPCNPLCIMGLVRRIKFT